MKNRNIGRRVVSGILTVFLLVGMCTWAGATEDLQTQTAGKIINVVYDDSRSMYLNGKTRWCQAKYAMEVFCAMMGEGDTMNIYAMNNPEILTLRGKDKSRVEQVHNMTSHYAGTPFATVKKAGSALQQENPAYERWLVVLTDGSFDNTSKETVQSTLDAYNADGIKTVYLAIGESAVELQGNTERGAFAEKAANTEDILTKVTSIANQIFEHQVVGEKFITQGAATVLDIDIPTEQIVVFAQGEGASVGAMTLNGRTIAPTEVQNVRHSGDVMPLNQESITVDTSLYGVVATYEAGRQPFEDGQFSVSVSNATAVEYYYRPGVKINCELRYGGRVVQSGDKFYAGDYEVALSFINPLTGKVVDSELLKDAKFSLLVTNNGTQQLVDSKEGTVSLEPGDVDLRAEAALPGNVFLTDRKSYGVLPEPIILLLKVEWKYPSYTVAQLGPNAVPAILRVTNQATGTALSEAEWAATEVRLPEVQQTDNKDIDWVVSRGTEVSTWELRPVSTADTLKKAATGDFEFDLVAEYEMGDQVAHGTSTVPLKVTEYTGTPLSVEIAKPTQAYDLNNMDSPEELLVTVKYEDPQTRELMPLTQAMWDDMKIKVRSEEHVDWTLEKGSQPGTWKLRPGFYQGDPLRTDSGGAKVELTASAKDGEYEYSGSGSQEAEFTPLSRENFLKRLIPRLLMALFLLWLIIGYLKKKRLHTRGLNPRCSFKGTTSPKQKISKDFLSVILPYVPEKATVKCHKSAFQCNFPDLRIQAVGRRSFKIINKSMPLKTTKICGEYYADMETLKKRTFAFGSFDITTVNPKINKSMGTFTFN